PGRSRRARTQPEHEVQPPARRLIGSMGRNTHSRRFKDDDIGGVDSALDAEVVGQRRDSARSADQDRPVRMVNGPGRERFLPVLAAPARSYIRWGRLPMTA